MIFTSVEMGLYLFLVGLQHVEFSYLREELCSFLVLGYTSPISSILSVFCLQWVSQMFYLQWPSLTLDAHKYLLGKKKIPNSFLDMISQDSDTGSLQWSQVCDF